MLRLGGIFIFNAWDRIEENEFADTVTTALEALFPHDPPRFLARTPHGYHDVETIERDLAAGGFTASPEITTLASRSHAASCDHPAIAYCEGTPLRNEIEAARILTGERNHGRCGSYRASVCAAAPVDGKIKHMSSPSRNDGRRSRQMRELQSGTQC